MSNKTSIGSVIKWTHPLTSELFEGTVVRIEDWFEPEKFSATDSSFNLAKTVTERYLVFWTHQTPMDERRSWIYGTEQLNLA
jgi:hypothetical protein